MIFDVQKLMDKTGWALLRLLQQNSRLTYAEMGKQVGLTAPGVADRIRRMEDAGIISSYQVKVDMAKLGFPIQAIIRISGCVRSSQLVEMVRNVLEVQECHRVTGSDCFIMKIVAASIVHLEVLIEMFEPYGQVTTSLILSSPISDRVVEAALLEVKQNHSKNVY
jgi:Lrp/AsnC family transcriptional regulator, leucine-responsive regulatory protein